MAFKTESVEAKRSDGVRRAQILDAAARRFASSGYVGTSLRDVADSCGILAGSLYHHFESKESIAVELLQNYQDGMNALGCAARVDYRAPRIEEVFERVVSLATSIASCAITNRAALQLTQYEPHAAAGERLLAVAGRRSVAVTSAMNTLLDDARAVGFFDDGVDVWSLSEQICDSMLHAGSSIVHANAHPQAIAEMTVGILFDGLVADELPDETLNRSAAMAAATDVLKHWSADDSVDHRTALLRAVARVEFARRGYEATTVRHIAAATSMGIGSVYRTIGSKRELLDSIMSRFHVQLSAAYRAVADVSASPIEKLDALSWINVNALAQFDKEFQIQRAWFRMTPPAESPVLAAIVQRGRILERVMSDGFASGHLDSSGREPRSSAASVRDLMWIPTHVFDFLGATAALDHTRRTVLRGAASGFRRMR